MRTQDQDYLEAVSSQTARQLDQFIESLHEIGAGNMLGVYLHGSLALLCFQAGRSDLDLLVLLMPSPTPKQRRASAQLLLQLSRLTFTSPKPGVQPSPAT